METAGQKHARLGERVQKPQGRGSLLGAGEKTEDEVRNLRGRDRVRPYEPCEDLGMYY